MSQIIMAGIYSFFIQRENLPLSCSLKRKNLSETVWKILLYITKKGCHKNMTSLLLHKSNCLFYIRINFRQVSLFR